MSDFAFPDIDTVDAQDIYASFPINLTRMLLHSPTTAKAYLQFAWSFRSCSLDPAVRELVILRVAALTECSYEIHHHIDESRATGTSESLIRAILDTRVHDFVDESTTVLVRYVDSVIRNTGATEETRDAVRAEFSARSVAEITLLAGSYLLCATYVKSLGVRIDEEPADWASMKSPR